MKLSYSKLFQVKPGSKVSLRKVDPDFTAVHTKKKSAGKEVDRLDRKLSDFQYLLYAEGKQSLLICLQALDGAGKDGLINHVLGAMNPQGARVHGFKAPTKEEASQDFLWRIEKQAPRKGEVVIFNRSHYEDVLVARVHRLVPAGVWKQRFARINAFEKSLVATGTRVLKFFLHISPEEQLRRFTRRLGDPTRQWKISEGDYEEREFWDDYTQAYEEALSRTSTRHAPWFVIPSDNKWFCNLAVANILVETMAAMNMRFPAPKVNLEEIRRKYHAAETAASGKIGKQKWRKFIADEGLMPKTAKTKRSAKRSRTLPAAKSPRKTGAAPPVKTPVLEPAPEPVAWIGS